ncbi:unnamed protein product, partial [Scytosiphon promiscuus]
MRSRNLGHAFVEGDHHIPILTDEDHGRVMNYFGEKSVTENQRTWELLSDAVAVAPFDERVFGCKTVFEAWCAIVDWISPSSEAEIALMRNQLTGVRNFAGEDPKFFFARVDNLAAKLRHVNRGPSEVELVRIILNNLSDEYDI